MTAEQSILYGRGTFSVKHACPFSHFPPSSLNTPTAAELRGTDNVQDQKSEHNLTANEGYCIYYPASNIFRNTHSIFSWGLFSHVTRLDQLRGSENI